jgi:hypothetical protein
MLPTTVTLTETLNKILISVDANPTVKLGSYKYSIIVKLGTLILEQEFVV